LKKYGFENAEFFMDTSYFVRDNWDKYKKEVDENYVVININSN
jgi:hypothetical protein